METTKLNIDNFTKRKLSRNQAELIAKNMYDLGDDDKQKVALALGGRKMSEKAIIHNPPIIDEITFEQLRFEAYKRLDPTSKLVIENILTEDDLESANLNFNYLIQVLSRVNNTIQQISSLGK